MNILFLDDSFAFDGFSPSSRPLGGAEKAFASLPGALARRGHTVSVYNRCRWAVRADGVEWNPLEGADLPAVTDVLIALNRPALLKSVRLVTKQRILWYSGPPRLLRRPAAQAVLEDGKALTLLFTAAQMRDGDGLKTALLPPALRSEYLSEQSPTPTVPPVAVVTTHPAWGLDSLVRMWSESIHPALPEAELHIYSAILSTEPQNGDEWLPLRAQIQAAEGHGVRVKRPLYDQEMARIYREARVHLYPGHPDDMTAFTLLESQACGLPAVIRPLGAAPERVENGQTAYVAPDEAAFANLTQMMLADDGLQGSLAQAARQRCRGWDWDRAARHLDSLLGTAKLDSSSPLT